MKINKHMKQVGDIKDRGSTKWQGMFLNEHVQMLRDWYEEKEQDQKPELDEFDLNLLQEEMEVAFKRKCTMKIKSWKNKKFYYHMGTIEGMDASSQSIVYEDPYGQHLLTIVEIVAVMMVD